MRELNLNNLQKGNIGLIHFYLKVSETEPSQEEKEKTRDDFVRKRLNAMMKKSIRGNEPIDIEQEFMKSWNKGNEISNYRNMKIIPFSTYHQVGQKESLQELLKIEQRSDFYGWLNPLLILELKNI